MRFASALFVASSLFAQTTPPAATLQIAPAQLRFEDVSAGYSQTITIASEGEVQNLTVSIDGGSATLAAPPWLEISTRAITTPGRLRVTISQTRRPPAGAYSARILFSVLRSNSPPTIINVALVLKTTGVPFKVAPESLRFIGQVGSFLPGQYIVLPPGITCAEVTARSTDDWLGVAPEPIPNCNRFLVSARPRSASPAGAYKGSIVLTYKSERVTVGATAFLLPPGPWLDTNPNGFQFEVREGNGNSVTRNLSVINRGTGTISWRAQDIFGPTPWMSLGAISGTASSTADGRLPITVSPGNLPDGTYHAVIEVSAAGARNSPELVTIVMRVFPSDTVAVAQPSPSGMIFNVVEGAAQSDPQVGTVFVSSNQLVQYRVQSQVTDGDGTEWLLTAPASGNTSTGAPARFNVAVRPGLLKPGVYQGEVNVYITSKGSSEIRAMNVTMVVRPKPKAAALQQDSGRNAENCTPAKLAPTHTGLVNNFSTNAGWPTPINLRVVDDCGDQVNGAQAVLSFSNGDAPLVLTNLLNGNYAGTWVPRSTSSPVTMRADVAQGQLSASIELTGKVSPTGTPVVDPNGVVNNFSPQAGGPLAPGTVIAIFGGNLAGGTVEAKAENNRLPEFVSDTAVVLGGARLPLYFVSPGQVNAQMRMDTQADQLLPLVIKSGNSLSAPVRVPVLAAQPGLLSFADTKVIAHDENFALLSSTNPAKRGRPVILYLVGMGITSPSVDAGLVSPGQPLAAATAAPQVAIGGKRAQVLFAGLTPASIGLYQINIVIPADLTPGDAKLVVSQGGVESNEVIVPVQ